MKATVGRIVHFYDTTLTGRQDKLDGVTLVNLNGQGAGPYPALVLQSFPGGPYINLEIHAWGGDWTEGSIAERGSPEALASTKYWTWPPREEG